MALPFPKPGPAHDNVRTTEGTGESVGALIDAVTDQARVQRVQAEERAVSAQRTEAEQRYRARLRAQARVTLSEVQGDAVAGVIHGAVLTGLAHAAWSYYGRRALGLRDKPMSPSQQPTGYLSDEQIRALLPAAMKESR
jgi:hypothetical protein